MVVLLTKCSELPALPLECQQVLAMRGADLAPVELRQRGTAHHDRVHHGAAVAERAPAQVERLQLRRRTQQVGEVGHVLDLVGRQVQGL